MSFIHTCNSVLSLGFPGTTSTTFPSKHLDRDFESSTLHLPFAYNMKRRLCKEIVIPLLSSPTCISFCFDLPNPAVIPSPLLHLYASVEYLASNIHL